MDNTKEKFAVIFHYFDILGTMRMNCVALIDHDELANTFTVKGGNSIFENKTDKDFHILSGSPEFIYGNNEKMSLDKRGNSLYAIYIFSDYFIQELLNENYGAKIDVYVYIAKKICGITFDIDDRMVVAKSSRTFNNDPNFFSRERISYMLYGREKIDMEIDNKKISDKTKKYENFKSDTQNVKVSLNNINELLQTFSSRQSFGNGSRKMDEDIEAKIYEYLREKQARENENKIDVNAIIKEISEKIVGQEEAIISLVTNIYFNQVLIDRLANSGSASASLLDSTKVSILLDGSTGTGKTAIAKEIATKLDLPIVMASANSFSETGYVGPTITDILQKLLEQANGDMARAERGIVFLDEIDKLASNTGFHGKDMKRGVQEELLAFIGGGMYDVRSGESLWGNSIQFDTSKLTFILSGAFTELRDRKIKEKEEKGKKGIGFSINNSDSQNDRTYTISAQDYIDEGLMREFFGRVKVLVSTKTYSVEDLKNILLTSTISPLENFQKVVEIFGYNGIIYSEEFIDRFANEAYNMGTGARALQTIMSGIQNMLLLNIINGEFDKYKPIELTIDMINQYKGKEIRRY